MRVLFIGDVVGKQGRKVVKYYLDEYLDEYDFVIANLENASHGKGLTKNHFLEMVEAGIDVVTLGNHYYAKKEIETYIDDYDCILRPANLHKSVFGRGSEVYNVNGLKIRVTNLMGRVYISEQLNNPFDVLESIVDSDDYDIHIVDFHAEATGEKQALAWAFDGKLTALFGTHTHIQTNDLRKLKQGTVYMSDVGMCGPYNGILGSNREAVIKKSWTGIPTIFDVQEDDEFIFSAVSLTIDDDTKKVIDYEVIKKVLLEREM